MFRKTNLIIAILTVVFATISSVAIIAVFIALGVITPDIPTSLLEFIRNVGYSIFAGGIIIVLIELPKAIRDLMQDSGA